MNYRSPRGPRSRMGCNGKRSDRDCTAVRQYSEIGERIARITRYNTCPMRVVRRIHLPWRSTAAVLELKDQHSVRCKVWISRYQTRGKFSLHKHIIIVLRNNHRFRTKVVVHLLQATDRPLPSRYVVTWFSCCILVKTS